MSITKQAKPEGMSDEEFAGKVKDEKEAAQGSCDFLEASGFNAITSETDPKNRMAEIEKFTAAFPNSKFQDQVSNYALYTLGPGQLNDKARLVSFGEKTLATNPNSLPALLLLAGYYGDDTKPGSAAKAIGYAQKAIEVAKADAPDADKSRKASAGAAHNTIGWAYLKQEKTTTAIPELKAAAGSTQGTGRAAVCAGPIRSRLCLRQIEQADRSPRSAHRGRENVRSAAGDVAGSTNEGQQRPGQGEMSFAPA